MPMMAFNVSQSVETWLRKKRKKQSINMSGYVNELLETAMIAEMESQLTGEEENENTQRLPDQRTDNDSGSATTPDSI